MPSRAQGACWPLSWRPCPTLAACLFVSLSSKIEHKSHRPGTLCGYGTTHTGLGHSESRFTSTVLDIVTSCSSLLGGGQDPAPQRQCHSHPLAGHCNGTDSKLSIKYQDGTVAAPCDALEPSAKKRLSHCAESAAPQVWAGGAPRGAVGRACRGAHGGLQPRRPGLRAGPGAARPCLCVPPRASAPMPRHCRCPGPRPRAAGAPPRTLPTLHANSHSRCRSSTRTCDSSAACGTWPANATQLRPPHA